MGVCNMIEDVMTTMAKDQEVSMVEAKETTVVDSARTFEFSKPYTFERKIYECISLDGLDSLTTKDMIEAEKYTVRNGMYSATPEMTMSYAMYIASKASKLPIEFFMTLPQKEALSLKNKIMGFIYNMD